MDRVTPDQDEVLEYMSDAQLKRIIEDMSVNPTEAQQEFVEGLKVLLPDRIGRRRFWTGSGSTKPAPLR